MNKKQKKSLFDILWQEICQNDRIGWDRTPQQVVQDRTRICDKHGWDYQDFCKKAKRKP